MSGRPAALVPDLEGRRITLDEYEAYAPENVELLAGNVFGSPDRPDPWNHTMALLLTNMGLVDAVKLAPKARWLAALRRVYGEDPEPRG